MDHIALLNTRIHGILQILLNSIDEYISSFLEEIRKLLAELRETIKASALEAIKKISYQIPTFYLNGNLVHFAGFKNHIGFYPTSSGIEAFMRELAIYPEAKGTLRFPFEPTIAAGFNR